MEQKSRRLEVNRGQIKICWKGERTMGQVERKGSLSAQKRITALVYFIQSDWQSERINNIKGTFPLFLNKRRKLGGIILCMFSHHNLWASFNTVWQTRLWESETEIKSCFYEIARWVKKRALLLLCLLKGWNLSHQTWENPLTCKTNPWKKPHQT